jgi:7-cyano-7-deazaguanine synthase
MSSKQMETRSIVLLSGGLDSAVALYWSLDRGYKVETLTFDYFRRSRKEIEACVALSRFVHCPNRRIMLGFLKEIDDNRRETRNAGLSSAESAYIPSRNLIFYGVAASFAEVGDSRYIIGGHNRNDTLNFPDSSAEFFELFNRTASLGRVTKAKTGKVILPFSKMDKSQVLKLGSRLGVPFELTWSCYRSGKTPCEKCLSCLLRAESFKKAGLEDPLLEK